MSLGVSLLHFTDSSKSGASSFTCCAELGTRCRSRLDDTRSRERGWDWQNTFMAGCFGPKCLLLGFVPLFPPYVYFLFQRWIMYVVILSPSHELWCCILMTAFVLVLYFSNQPCIFLQKCCLLPLLSYVYLTELHKIRSIHVWTTCIISVFTLEWGVCVCKKKCRRLHRKIMVVHLTGGVVNLPWKL